MKTPQEAVEHYAWHLLGNLGLLDGNYDRAEELRRQYPDKTALDILLEYIRERSSNM